jgi:hypothetical protein
MSNFKLGGRRPSRESNVALTCFDSALDVQCGRWWSKRFPIAENLDKTDKRRGAVTYNLGTIRGR